MTRTIIVADLFCGAGGMSEGVWQLCQEMGWELDLVAVNHWEQAIETHSQNHPYARHILEDIELVKPRAAVPGGCLDLLLAGPKCTHHSRARGGKPVLEQQRSHALAVIRWAEELYIRCIIIENVPEFRDWGPVGKNGKPLKSKKGEMYRAFLHMLRAMGYKVQDKVLVCANYGDPTTRERLFIMARRDDKPITWPEPTHSKDGASTLFGPMEKWVPARQIIDWSLPSESIFARKRPLKPNTIRRIVAGLKRFSGLPFIIGQQSGAVARSVDDPVPTVATAGAISLTQPVAFVLPPEGIHRGNAARSIDAPLQTVTASRGGGYLVEPFLAMFYGTGGARSVDEPAPTITASGGHVGLVQPELKPFLAMYHGSNRENGDRVRSIDDPIPTVAAEGVQLALVEPFVMTMEHSGMGADGQICAIDRPMRTITSGDGFALVEPFVIATNHGPDDGRCWPVSEPLRTVTGVDAWGLVESFLINYNGNGRAHSVDEPLGTVTGVDRYGLVLVIGNKQFLIDIRFRMLQPHELAGAQGFHKRRYVFKGNRRDVVKQIGNAVPPGTVKALCRSMLSGHAR